MLSCKKFNPQAGQAALSDLDAFERSLRINLQHFLREGFVRSQALPDKEHTDTHLRHRETLRCLTKAVAHFGTHNLQHRYEETKPLNKKHEYTGFSEALLTLSDDNGKEIHNEDLWKAVNNPEFDESIGPHFRLWLMASQIRNFYTNPENAGKRLSVNVVPADVDHEEFRDGLTQLMKVVKACGYTPMVLEAIEKGVWTKERAAYLCSLREHGAIIAIDDYGSPKGHNNAATLETFVKALKVPYPGKPETNDPQSPDPLDQFVVKLDGEVVRAFLDENNPALIQHIREVVQACPHALVVAEWVKDCKETKRLREALSLYHLDNTVHFVQSYTIKDSVSAFLRNMDEPIPFYNHSPS